MTFVLNRKLVITQGGWAWAWGIALRYIITALLMSPLAFLPGVYPLAIELRAHFKVWMMCSFIGFGLFGVGITWAASSGPAWLIAGAWQLTVIAGPLLAPLIYKDHRSRLSFGSLFLGLMIVLGVLIMEYHQSSHALRLSDGLPLAAVVMAACAYPVGNRLLLLHLERTGAKITTAQRVFGMTLASTPLWIILAGLAWTVAGPPTPAEILLAGGVALSSGVIGTILFFAATRLVHHDRFGLAAVEAMQCGEVIFSILFGSIFLSEAWPSGLGALGVALVVIGIIAFNVMGTRR